MRYFYRHFILPVIVPVGVVLVVGLIVTGIGMTLRHFYNEEYFHEEFKRTELYIAILAAIVVILGGGALAMYKGSLGALDQPVAIGHRPMLAPLPTPQEIQARRGPVGSPQDIRPGFILYARNGALAKVIEMLPALQGDIPSHRMGFIYAQGLHGADDELWIPVEAVAATYPQTKTAILAISGDETAAFGWNKPPAAFLNVTQDKKNKLY
jgi:hypothetical protein